MMDEHTVLSIMRHAPVMLFIKDKENNFVTVNNKLLEFFRRTAEQVCGKPISTVFGNELAQQYYKDDLEVINSGKPKYDILEKVEIGERCYWCRTDKVPRYDNNNNIIGIIGFSVDVTDQVKLIEKNVFLTNASDVSPSIIVITDIRHVITYVNKKFSDVTGYLSAEVIGKTPRIFKSSKTPKQTYDRLNYLLENGQAFIGDFLNKRKDGSLYWEMATIHPIKNHDETIIGFVKVAAPLDEFQHSIVNLWGVFEHADLCMIVLDEQMDIKAYNSRMAELLEVPDTTCLFGQNWENFILDTDKPILKAVHNSVIESGRVVREFMNEIVTTSGKKHLIKWFNTVINHNKHWTFSIGIPYSEGEETMETVRSTFKAILNKDKEIFALLKQGITKL